MEIEVPHSTARFIARNWDGRAFVWQRSCGGALRELEVGPAPPPGAGRFWRHDVDGAALVFVADDVVPQERARALALGHDDLRGRVHATWTCRFISWQVASVLALVGAFEALSWTLFPPNLVHVVNVLVSVPSVAATLAVIARRLRRRRSRLPADLSL